ncbi:MAG: SDR family oxidoreductase [Pedobacter sp.]|nr:MAG: SDR family oxidoreductase [Pedobacter sp.]
MAKVWITGASSGIGEALVYAYVDLGYEVLLSARNEAELMRVRLASKYPERCKILPLDLAQSDQLATKAETALSIMGHIDILVHSGGISQRALAMQASSDSEEKLLRVNFWGSVYLTKAILPSMIARNSGHIVCISSLVGKFGTPYRSAYSASKHALHGYFDSLRAELPTSLQVTLICPGFIKTAVTLNALTADGSAQGTMDDAQANGMSATDCAQKIVKAIAAKKAEAYIGGKETIGIYLKRFFPSLFQKIIRKAKVV